MALTRYSCSLCDVWVEVGVPLEEPPFHTCRNASNKKIYLEKNEIRNRKRRPNTGEQVG